MAVKYLAVLGRQPRLSMAELEALFGKITTVGRGLAEFEWEGEVEIARLGGSLKLAQALTEPVEEFLLRLAPGKKLVLGVSDYSPRACRLDAQREGLRLKKLLVKAGRNVRFLDNTSAILSTATVYHNRLGRKTGCVELMKVGHKWYVGTGVQDINAYAARDQARPARDARVGMLPPKLAQIFINLCGPLPKESRILDPFCGTGVVLQEALLMGYQPYGSDLSERMVRYSRRNLAWLMARAGTRSPEQISTFLEAAVVEGDACTLRWAGPIAAVACETYLGRPMSAAPIGVKLAEEKARCRGIILGFLRNIYPQVVSGTPLCLGVPAWLKPGAWRSGPLVTKSGKTEKKPPIDGYSRLNILDEIEQMGYNVIKFKSARQEDLLYHREGQVVAREIIVLRKK